MKEIGEGQTEKEISEGQTEKEIGEDQTEKEISWDQACEGKPNQKSESKPVKNQKSESKPMEKVVPRKIKIQAHEGKPWWDPKIICVETKNNLFLK